MSLTVTHTFVSGKSDGTDDTKVQPSHWNAAHTVSGKLEQTVNAITSGYRSILTTESGDFFSTDGSSDIVVVAALPSATPGLHYRFVHTGTTSSLCVRPKVPDVLRGAASGQDIESLAVGSWIYVWCVSAGTWEYDKGGTWTVTFYD